MNARIAYKKNKIVSERSSWIVSVYDKPFDIMKHDERTMSRLINEVYGKKSKNLNKEIIIRGITSKRIINYSNLTIDEHQG
tara:strand:- start:1011 stop:1253 length:243 start_codon:yes stop_codon:yes gene_type:complete